MHFKLAAVVFVTGALFLMPTRADAACCEQTMPACCDQAAMPCCDMKGHAHEADAIALLLPQHLQTEIAAPVRQTVEVWFMRPTWIGKTIAQGRYVIEHDNDRMARGEPCTHIYAFNNRLTPVATFHCTHLERDPARTATVVVVTLPDGMQKLTEFQFAGETAGHGYPADR